MKQIINRKVYDTKTASLVASDRYWDGSNFERHGRNTYLYKTPNGAFFSHHTTQWQGERDSIQALSVDEAKDLFERLPEHDMSYEAAFGEKPEEA
ncbi:hypothetical protein FBQ81_04050 [Chloroflexi bacterium CFX6]|nr:hypothetical protein [Chloroflexi bacterium CFX6]